MTTSGASDSPSIEARMVTLAKKALEQTRDGVIEWRTTDDDDAFIFAGTKTSLIIDYYRHDDHYEFRIINDRGVMVEELARYPRSGILPSVDPWGAPKEDLQKEDHQLFADLHEAARRSAYDIDSLLDSAFEDVAAPPDPPKAPSTRGPWTPPDEPPF